MIRLSNVGLRRDDWILRHIDLTIEQGARLGVIGKSGIGKTTLLKIMSGLLDVQEGEVYLDDRRLIGPTEKLIPGYEDIQLVHQDFGLEPYHSVLENVREKVLGLHEHDRDALVDEYLELVELSHLSDRKAHQLSGGEQQRLSIARALACEPRVLLLDEPFVHLDQRLRLKIVHYLLALNEVRNMTIVLVSHDGAEIIGFAERVVHLKDQSIVRSAPADQLFYEPDDLEQGELMGVINQVKLGEGSVLFRPNAYVPGDQLKLEFKRSFDTGLVVFNYFSTENGEEVVLTASTELKELRGINVNWE